MPHGDDSGVVIIPGFLANDIYMMQMYAWLKRIGYRPYYSGIGLNADCPNLLIGRRLNDESARSLFLGEERVDRIELPLSVVDLRDCGPHRGLEGPMIARVALGLLVGRGLRLVNNPIP